MSKYIDAEKLIALIDAKLEDLGLSGSVWVGRSVLQDLKNDIIATLQQEQPFPRWIHANYSDKPEIRYTPSGTPYLQNRAYMIWLSDLETLPKDGTDLTNSVHEQPDVNFEDKFAKFLERKDAELGANSWSEEDLRELAMYFCFDRNNKQPEVDLEKEISNYMKTHHLHIKDGGRVVFDNDDSSNFMCDIRDIARHFYELGLNARKEGTK